MKKTLLVSVGGSPAPVIYTINQHRPAAVIYFCSRDSRAEVRAAIEPKLDYALTDCEIITTPDEQNLKDSVAELVHRLPRTLHNLDSDMAHLQADFTGGTKVMAAAVVLALADQGCSYSYVGGVGRDKQGLGVVVDGREQLLYSDNPWDALGREPLKLYALHFNRCRFASAAQVAARAAERSDKLRPLFETLQVLADGYRQWDNFEHKPALNLLNRCRQALKTLPFLHEGQQLSATFAGQLEADIKRLEQVKNDLLTLENKATHPSDGQALLLDLLANAVRRAESEHKYDDAVARLYSVVEKAAKMRLFHQFAIDNSKVCPEQIPALHRELILRGMSANDNNVFPLPLAKSYALLAALGDELGATYQQRETDLAKVLAIRNSSLLAHGFQPVSQKTYTDLLAIALNFCAVQADSLPTFPRLAEE